MEKSMIKRSTINQALVATALCVALAAPAFAEGEMPDSEHGRYSFSKVAEGFLRLDTQTGQVSVCSQRAVGWACQAAPEDRAAFESEIARLRGENAALKQSLLAHGLPLPSGATAEQGARNNEITIRLPDNDDLDRARAYIEDVWRRFVDAVAKAQRQLLNKS
jgi:hypothetical protein